MQSLARRLVALGLLAGCSCGGAPPPTPTTAPSAVTYSVHEWGLVRAGSDDTLSVGARGPSSPPMADFAVVEKPVLYFHLAGGSTLAGLSATVDAHEGEIREHWPRASTRTPHAVTWSFDLHAAERCAAPTFEETDCASLDPGEACETPELARAQASDVACPTVDAHETPFLFYRVRTRSLTVPLVVTTQASGELTVRNDGDAPIPGRLVRFLRTGGRVRVVVVEPPAAHQTIVVGQDFGEPDLARAAVIQSFDALGLTTQEASAFLASWDAAFFGPFVSEEIVERAPVEEMPVSVPEDSLLYFLPASDVDRLAQLSFDPAPTEVHRAMAVWTTIP